MKVSTHMQNGFPTQTINVVVQEGSSGIEATREPFWEDASSHEEHHTSMATTMDCDE
jgi:hypothetical protein